MNCNLNNNDLYQQINDIQAAEISGGGLLGGIGKTIRGITDEVGQTVDETTDGIDQTLGGLLGSPKPQNGNKTLIN